MKLNKKHLAAAGVALFLIAATAMLAHRAWSEKQQQTDLLTNFYKEHLNRPEKRTPSQLPTGSFYSQELEALIAANGQLCDSLSRGDEICGYGADGDVFLQSQEGAPDLDFYKSGFKAVRSSDGMVDVSFNVYPEQGEFYARRLTYVLIREPNGWRVNDVLFADGGSMRQEIRRENDAILASASELADAATWVFHYLGNEDAIERAERFIAFPVQVCDEYGICVAMKRGDTRVRLALDALHSAYYGHDHSGTEAAAVMDLGFLPKAGQVAPGQGKVVALDALDFTYQNKAWWITKIDLRRRKASAY